MIKRLHIVFLLFIAVNFLYAQKDSKTNVVDLAVTKDTLYPKNINSPVYNLGKEFIFKPTIGLGVGMFSFYGDMYTNHFQPPMVSRIGYELNIAQELTKYLELSFYILYGKVGANERDVANNRNLNFESQISSGGINLTYNFDNFLPVDRSASPYISVGLESFEFLSKTDMYDQYGNKYNYWQDGTIRNMAENDPNASKAIEIYRDYTYETDVREVLNVKTDGFKRYPEHSFAIPIGAGVTFKINDYLNFKLGSTIHFTFTDYIDGVTANSMGNRVGNSKSDNFMMSSFSICYNLGTKSKEPTILEDDNTSNVDFLVLDTEDQDKDGITDIKDLCLDTPMGVSVDSSGCPLDDDGDGIPNYKDNEINSPKTAIVDSKGVQMNDSTIAYQYNVYNDSVGSFVKIEIYNRSRSQFGNPNPKGYTVELGKFQTGLSAETIIHFLSISDISSTSIDDSTTIFTAGSYSIESDAKKRKDDFVSQGFADAKVIFMKNGKYEDGSIASNLINSKSAKAKSLNNKLSKTDTSLSPIISNPISKETLSKKGLVYRIQLGAYKNRLPKTVFKEYKDLIELKTDDGLYKYMTGSYGSFDDASKHRQDVLLNGYSGAFIAAFKDGKGISLLQAEDVIAEKPDTLSAVNDSLLPETVNTKLSEIGEVNDSVQVEKNIPLNSIGIPASLKVADINNDGVITGDEISKAIDACFEGDSYFTVEKLKELIHYFQSHPQNKQ
jgi:hypothetical protein